jgi:hypothetical protein
MDVDSTMQEHQKVISGNAFLVNRGTISWSSQKKELITLLTAEAKYIVAMHAAKEGIWLHHLIIKPFTPNISTTPLYCDNQATCKLATTDNYHACTKHIDVHYHFIQQTIQDKIFDIIHCPPII